MKHHRLLLLYQLNLEFKQAYIYIFIISLSIKDYATGNQWASYLTRFRGKDEILRNEHKNSPVELRPSISVRIENLVYFYIYG